MFYSRSHPSQQGLFWKWISCCGNQKAARLFVGAMLNPHRQSVLTNACIKPSGDPINRTPGTIYESKGQVRLLGLLSESCTSRQEDYLDAGDGMLICVKRANKKSTTSTRKGCLEPEKLGPNSTDASDPKPESKSSRQQEVQEEPTHTTSDPKASSPSPSPQLGLLRQPHPGSFPFQWMWERFSIKGQATYQDQSLEKGKKKNFSIVSKRSASEPFSTSEPGSGSPRRQGFSDTKDKSSDTKEMSEGPKELRYKHQKHRQLMGPSPESSLLPLYWKMEARSEARKRQLRQERQHWFQLTQQLLNLEDRFRWSEKRLSTKQLEEKLRAEMLCLVTEPVEPCSQKEKIRAKTAKEELTFKPTINRKIPNFKNLQKRFQEQLEQKKDQAKHTICKPFHLTSDGSSQTFSGDEEKQDQEDPFYDLGNFWGVHWRTQSCPDFGPPSVQPVMHTKTSDKRQEANRLLLLEWERREQQEKWRAEMRRLKEQQVQREVARCLAGYRSPRYSDISVQKRRKELRRQEKQRMEEYFLQLQEMQDRVESRPYLFERVMQDNARQAVQRRFSQVLSALSIDEEMLWKHAVRQAAGKCSSKARYKRTDFPDDFSEQI
ncbi:testis-specific protein 10-interacting protein [Heteronotia binoei]|uniref:testis-specific protein 10-interacting protein n=1 Tax=Heteronotia binoei TaxID=13085 RepID=UPI00292D3BD3|nr:testis-specific protein 10-interacting protein [Heteronotia binoei]